MPEKSQNSHFKAGMTFLRVFRGETVTDSVIQGDQGRKKWNDAGLRCPSKTKNTDFMQKFGSSDFLWD